MTLHASSAERTVASPRMWPPEGRWQTGARLGALLLPLVTCAVLSTARDRVTAATAVLVLVLWVVAAAATGDRVAGLMAAVSGGMWFDFFLTAPYRQFAIKGSDDVEATVLLVLIGLAVTEIALWGHRGQARAAGRSGYLEGVLGAARLVSEGDTPASALLDVVARQITEVLGADDCRFEPGQVADERVAVLRHDGTVARGDHTVDVDRVGMPTNDYVAIPVCRGSRVVGHFLVIAVSHVSYPSSEQRRVAVLLADQVAAAVEVR